MTAVLTDLTTRHATTFQTSDFDEAREYAQGAYYPMDVALLRPQPTFRFSCDLVQLGPITLGELHHAVDLRLTTGDLVTSYHVTLPITGRLRSTHRGHTTDAHAGCAAVYRPVGENECVWRGDSRFFSVKIDRAALESQLELALDRPARPPLAFSHSLDVSAGTGRSWARLVRLVAAELHKPDSLVAQPWLAGRMADSLIAGLLYAADHPYRDELTHPASRLRPRTVKRAIDAMQSDLAHPFTVVELAQLSQVSVRALQEAFRRHTGMAPMAYLRQLRLAQAHDELVVGDARVVTVAEVAQRAGFAHLGRFAAAYRDRYGRSPSSTLRSAD